MGNLSIEFNNNCCGTTCDKLVIHNRIKELEAELETATNKLMDYESEWSKNKDQFAKKCFIAGHGCVDERAWLQFKAVEL